MLRPLEKEWCAMTDVNLVNGVTYLIRQRAELLRLCNHGQCLFLLVSEKVPFVSSLLGTEPSVLLTVFQSITSSLFLPRWAN